MRKTANIISVILALILGILIGFAGMSYIKLPKTEAVESEVSYIAIDDADISVHFLELGNKYTGDCTYIKTDTSDILIDCGSRTDSVKTVSAYLNQYVTDGTLEYVIVTHAHQDHYAGFATSKNQDSIFDLYECKNVITFEKTNQTTSTMYNNFKRELAEEKANGANVYTARQCVEGEGGASQTYQVGTGVTLTILDSYYYYNKASSENDYSVCSLVTYQSGSKTKNMLFTGDLEEAGEIELVNRNTLPEIDLYKAGHHGSKTSSSETLLDVIKPKTVCVCCCAGSPEYTKTNENQFPTQKFINNVAKHTEEVYVTTLCVDYQNNVFEPFNGNIIYICKSINYYVNCTNNNTKLKDSEWFKANRVWPTK